MTMLRFLTTLSIFLIRRKGKTCIVTTVRYEVQKSGHLRWSWNSAPCLWALLCSAYDTQSAHTNRGGTAINGNTKVRISPAHTLNTNQIKGNQRHSSAIALKVIKTMLQRLYRVVNIDRPVSTCIQSETCIRVPEWTIKPKITFT